MVFLLMRVAPGNPIQSALGGRLSQEEIAKREHARGLRQADPRSSTSSTCGDVVTLDLGTR